MSGYTRLNPASKSVTSGILSPASGVTVESERIDIYGKVAFLEVYIKHTAAWSVGTQYNIGTLANDYLPANNALGTFGTIGVATAITNGSCYVRPLFSASEISANGTGYARFSYILP